MLCKCGKSFSHIYKAYNFHKDQVRQPLIMFAYQHFSRVLRDVGGVVKSDYSISSLSYEIEIKSREKESERESLTI